MGTQDVPPYRQGQSYLPTAGTFTGATESIVFAESLFTITGAVVTVHIAITDMEFSTTGVFSFRLALPINPRTLFTETTKATGGGVIIMTGTLPSGVFVSAVVGTNEVLCSGNVPVDAADNTGGFSFAYNTE